jgi:hypothetical protein
MLFPNVIQLQENKRIRPEDRPKYDEIVHAILATNANLRSIIEIYFPDRIIASLEELKKHNITRGVSYFRTSSSRLNAFMHGYMQQPQDKQTLTLPNGTCYVEGGMLVCRKLVNTQEGRLYPNYWYEIKRLGPQNFVLLDMTDKTEYHVTHNAISQHFWLPYSNTVHAAQGDSIDVPFVIADCMAGCITPNWLYTAISRCTNLDHVWFLSMSLYELNVERECARMVCGYKRQDYLRGFEIKRSKYVDVKWIMSKLEEAGQCRVCKQHMVFEKHNPHKVTVNRLNNALPHEKENCELLCNRCNVGLGNRSDHVHAKRRGIVHANEK